MMCVNKKKNKKDKNKETAEIKPSAKLTLKDFIRVTKNPLTFHEWLKTGHPLKWNNCIETVCKQRVKELISDVTMHFPREAGHGWKMQKLHKSLHLVPAMKHFGCSSNFDAGIGKLLLQLFAKHPASTARSSTPNQFMKAMALTTS